MKWPFNKTIKNIFSNFIPHETVTCDDRDPPWINNNIKQLIQEKNDTYRIYILNDKNPQIFQKVKYLQTQLKNLIEHSQEKYCLRISKKFDEPDDKTKNLLVNIFLIENIVKQQKIPCIPPFLQDNKYVTDFKKKAELCNLLFARQCIYIHLYSLVMILQH